MAYGATEAAAREAVLIVALRVLADRLEHGEPLPVGLLDRLGFAA